MLLNWPSFSDTKMCAFLHIRAKIVYIIRELDKRYIYKQSDSVVAAWLSG